MKTINLLKERTLNVLYQNQRRRVLTMKTVNLFIALMLIGLLLALSAGGTIAQGPAPGDLVLWNKLGSQTEVENSEVGLDGVFSGGSFVEGMCGDAYSADYTEDLLVTFPKEVIPTYAGTIEFWAKLTGFPPNFSSGCSGLEPYFFRIGDGYSWFQMGFESNDGAGNGGLCAHVGHGFQIGTGNYGCSWTYEQILGSGQVEEWHHYALVWDQDGIPGVADGTRKAAVFLNGQLNTGRWYDYYGDDSEIVPLTGGQLGLIDNWASQGSVAIDNLTIWNYAKTDFSDRFVCEPTIVVPIDIKPGSDPNSINLKSKGVVPVAVLTTDDFDAGTVDPDSVEFAGAPPERWTMEDVDGDGDMDLLFHFKTQELDLTEDSTEATLTGETLQGMRIRGTDTVNTVPKSK